MATTAVAKKKKGKAVKKAAPKKKKGKMIEGSSRKNVTVSLKPTAGGEWTVGELAEKEGLHEKTVFLWIRQGKINARQAVKKGGVRGPYFIPKKGYKRPAGFVK